MSNEGAAGIAAPRRLGLGRVAFDMLMVIGSVLLALALDDWRDNREKRALTQNVLIALEQEIKANATAIDEALAYQDAMAIAFRESSQTFQKTGEFIFPDAARQRSAAVRFSRAAYDSALVSQVLPRLQVPTLLTLSALYDEQDNYADLLRTYAAATIQTSFNDGERYLRLRSNQYAELAEAERRLQPMLRAASEAVSAEVGR